MIDFKHMNFQGNVPWSGVYFHGVAADLVAQYESDGAPDLVSSDSPLCKHTVEPHGCRIVNTEYFFD